MYKVVTSQTSAQGVWLRNRLCAGLKGIHPAVCSICDTRQQKTTHTKNNDSIPFR